MKQIPQIDANTYNGNPMRTFSFFMRQMASEAILKTFYQAAGVYLNQFTNAILILNFFFSSAITHSFPHSHANLFGPNGFSH